MSGPTAVLDTNDLIPIRLVQTLLWLAEAGPLQPPVPMFADLAADVIYEPATPTE